MRRFIRSLIATVTLGIQAGLILILMLVAEAGAQATSDDGFATVPVLKHLSIWTSPTPAPECPEPAVDALVDAVSEMESGIAQ